MTDAPVAWNKKTRQRLQQASESMESAFVRTRSIQKRLGEVTMDGAPLSSEDEGDA